MGFIKLESKSYQKGKAYYTIMEPNMSYERMKSAEYYFSVGGEAKRIPNGMQTIRFDALGLEERESYARNVVYARQRAEGASFNTLLDKQKEWDEADYAQKKALAGAFLKDYMTNIEEKTLITISVTTDINGKIISEPEFIESTLSDEEYNKIVEAEKAFKDKIERYRKEAAEERERERQKPLWKKLKKHIPKKDLIKTIIGIIWALVFAVLFIIKANDKDWYVSWLFLLSYAGGIWTIFHFIKLIVVTIREYWEEWH